MLYLKSLNSKMSYRHLLFFSVLLFLLSGFISPVFVVLACTAFSGLLYIYSINQTAVKGIEMRRVEQEIANQKKTNEALKIKEAELKSLYRIEQQSKELNMVDCPDVKYIEENSSVAYGTE